MKVVSAQNAESLAAVAAHYGQIVPAGVRAVENPFAADTRYTPSSSSYRTRHFEPARQMSNSGYCRPGASMWSSDVKSVLPRTL